MILCVTEKPSVAADIAKILGATARRDGFYEGNGYRVSWTFGHLCELKEPNDYTDLWKRWSLGSLPMIPPRFGIKLKDDEGIKKQFHVIETLIIDSTELINCGDAGQEGELIQRWVYQKANCAIPVKRLWISSLTDDSIREGFKHLQPSENFDNLYYAGLSRAIGDWILGMNATRLYTLKYARSRNVLSIGRVQTPTLALIVSRQREIENFVPEDYWEIKTLYRGVTFNSTKGRYKSEEDANTVIAGIKEAPLSITGIERKKGKEAPPRLFDLTSLQVECNKKFSYSADMTLRTIQSLYEKKVTTYPRVDTTFLSDDIYPKIPGIMQAMAPYAHLTAPVLQGGAIKKSKKVFDNSKVTDHHAIIPTNVDPRKVMLTRDEKLVYDLVAKRFIAAFYPDCEFSTTTVMAKISEFEFKATGKQILKEGWRAIYSKDKTANNTEGSDTDDNGNVSFYINNGNIPELRVSSSFSELMETYRNNKEKMSRREKEALLYAKQKVERAMGYIEAIKQRYRTLTLTMQAIIDWQRKFFQDGDEADLKPMILKNIADRTGLDISTISRVSNVKYAQTNWGTYPLRFFFSDGYTNEDGEEMSTRKIKIALKDLVDKENKAKPLSDDALREALVKLGYPIARRTVAKYREQLGIPVARMRKN